MSASRCASPPVIAKGLSTLGKDVKSGRVQVALVQVLNYQVMCAFAMWAEQLHLRAIQLRAHVVSFMTNVAGKPSWEVHVVRPG